MPFNLPLLMQVIPFLGLMTKDPPASRPHLTRLIEQLVVAVTAALTMYTSLDVKTSAELREIRASVMATRLILDQRADTLEAMRRYLERGEDQKKHPPRADRKNVPPQ